MDEEQTQARLAELDTLLAQEEKMWEVEQVNRGMILVDAYLANIKIRMLTRILQERFHLDEDYLNIIIKEEALLQLKKDRKMAVKAMKEQMLMNPGPPPHNPFQGMLGPNGKPL